MFAMRSRVAEGRASHRESGDAMGVVVC